MTGRLELIVPPPLPECQLCERPTRRATWEANAGLCSECSDAIRATAAMLPPVTPIER